MSNTPFSLLPITIGALQGTEIVPLDQNGTTKSATVRQIATSWIVAFPAAMEFVIDGGGSAIIAGTKGYLEVPFNATISQVTLLADQAGTITIDIWKCTEAQFDAGVTHPVAADSIVGGAYPLLTAQTKYQAVINSASAWTRTLTAGDVLAFNVVSSVIVQRITISLRTTRSLTS